MSGIAPEVWSRLAGERAQGETLWARRAAPDLTERLVAALDADGGRHLLILLEPNDAGIVDSQSRGIQVQTRELVMPGHESGRYLDIACHDATGHDAFNLIGGELAERLATGAETAPEVVARVISKWRRFWGQLPKQLLSRERQCGLFAELWFLCFWLIPRSSVSEAVARWRGPSGARHDFEWPGRSVEVKATTSVRGRVHRINGLDQLARPDHGDLFFFSLLMREEAGAANTLTSVVSACRAQLGLEPNVLELFENALARAGYSSTHENEYAKLRLRVAEQGLFVVRDNFPRLTLSQFPQGIPPGIEHVEYDIDLGGFAHLCVARQPGEANFL